MTQFNDRRPRPIVGECAHCGDPVLKAESSDSGSPSTLGHNVTHLEEMACPTQGEGGPKVRVREHISPRMMQDAASFHDRAGAGSEHYMRGQGLSGMSASAARKMIKDARQAGWEGSRH